MCVVIFELANMLTDLLHSWNTIINPLITMFSIETNCSIMMKWVISFHFAFGIFIITIFYPCYIICMYVWKWHASFNNTKITFICQHVQHKLSFRKYLYMYDIILVSVSEFFYYNQTRGSQNIIHGNLLHRLQISLLYHRFHRIAFCCYSFVVEWIFWHTYNLSGDWGKIVDELYYGLCVS